MKHDHTLDEFQDQANQLESILKIIHRIASSDSLSVNSMSTVEASDHFCQIANLSLWASEKARKLSVAIEEASEKIDREEEKEADSSEGNEE